MHIIRSISEFHRLLGLREPLHPLISIIDVTELKLQENAIWDQFTVDFYSISIKKNIQAKVRYGRQHYDFDKGVMNYFSPKQIQSFDMETTQQFIQECGQGWMLLLHPDFLAGHPLAQEIRNYGFFSYAVNEALHLSEKEEAGILDIFKKIEAECTHIDRHTQPIILSKIGELLHYSNRFYERQFITRKTRNHDLLSDLEALLNNYFDREEPLKKGLPSVEFIARQLNLSTHYLSDMLRSYTGLNAQQHIHEKVIEKAKEYLLAGDFSVAEIAYKLGFEYPQSFNKLFRKKTAMTPLKFRSSLN
ncbi:helix-turn-helix domain-containing protein [Sphingobacterium paludis]|uniref:AraC family transcriptional regulator n=1 Tax=Sphingobacterium paludis TaxID=1476465 RepID=A0A4R7D5J4_9SPHI|nr:response regulator transcription factor [Sphingobacterium paludis]TDS14964.1 AraC family transcriptional regulator [Sphingobacterium paludis]